MMMMMIVTHIISDSHHTAKNGILITRIFVVNMK